jgi:hypothetical protein
LHERDKELASAKETIEVLQQKMAVDIQRLQQENMEKSGHFEHQMKRLQSELADARESLVCLT